MKLEKVDDEMLINMDLVLGVSHIDNEYSFHLVSGYSYTVAEDELNPVMKPYIVGLI